MGIRNYNLMLILNPLEKLQNIQAKQFIDEKVMGKRSFLHLFLCTKVFHNLFSKTAHERPKKPKR
jgi:hypothetical protein